MGGLLGPFCAGAKGRVSPAWPVLPVHVAAYIEQLQGKLAAPTVKQHLACIRMLFDWLVTGQVVPSNPAHSVRGPRFSVSKGVTPVLSSEEASALLAGMDVSTVVGLRDRAIIAVMTYSFARVGAVVRAGRRGLFSAEKTLVAPPPREKRQAQRNALPSQAGRLSRRLYRGGGHRG